MTTSGIHRLSSVALCIGLLALMLCICSCHQRRPKLTHSDDAIYDYVYDEIHCAGWSSKYTDEEMKNVIQQYLKDSLKTTSFDDVIVSHDGYLNNLCDSCQCFTGRRVYLKALGKFSNELDHKGFFIALPDE